MFLLTTDTFKPSGYSYKTCRIVLTSHVYGLTFISGGSGGGGGVTRQKAAQSGTVSPFVNVKPVNILKGDHGTISSEYSPSLMSSLVGSCLTSLDEGTKGPTF